MFRLFLGAEGLQGAEEFKDPEPKLKLARGLGNLPLDVRRQDVWNVLGNVHHVHGLLRGIEKPEHVPEQDDLGQTIRDGVVHGEDEVGRFCRGIARAEPRGSNLREE